MTLTMTRCRTLRLLVSGLSLPLLASWINVKRADAADSAQRVLKSCWDHFSADDLACNTFVNAVATDLGFPIFAGQSADGIITTLTKQVVSGSWTQLADGAGNDAQNAANGGAFVIGGLKHDEITPSPGKGKPTHGHVVIIVTGSVDHNGFPTGFWGQLPPGHGSADVSISRAFKQADAKRCHYFTAELP